MQKIFKSPILYIAIAFVIAFGFRMSLQSGSTTNYETANAQKGELIQTVSATGNVKAAENVNLAFENGGKINRAYVKVNDKVKRGQILASTDNADLLAQLRQYEAARDSQQATLDQYKSGTRPEEIAIAETTAANARISLQNVRDKAASDLINVYKNTKDILQDAYSKSDDALNNQLSAIFTSDNSNAPMLSFDVTEPQAKSDAEWQRYLATLALAKLLTTVSNPATEQASLDSALSDAALQLDTIRLAVIRSITAVDSSAGLSATTIATYKTSANTGRANMNTAVTNVNQQQQSIAAQKITNQNNISAAENTLTAAEDNLKLKQAGYTAEQIAAQRAAVNQADANIAYQQARIAKTLLVAPFNGTITRQDAKVGQIVAPGATLIELISESNYEIEAYIAEVDIATIKLNDTADVTLDAYGQDKHFKASVIKIDPAETVIEGLPTYKITLMFSEQYPDIKSGLTANLDILTNKKENAINIPQRGVLIRDGQKYARVLNADGTIKEITVTTGLRGANGNIEILTGVNEGDKIIISN